MDNRIVNRVALATDRAALKITNSPSSGLEVINNKITVQDGTLAFFAETLPNTWTVRQNSYQVTSTRSPVYRIANEVFRAWEIDSPNLGRLNRKFGLEKGSQITVVDDE
jgi:hypothetical protein